MKRSMNGKATVLWLALCFIVGIAHASRGDQLPEFRECVQVCISENCGSNEKISIPLHRRLLFWTCPSECDYTCQHITTESLVSSSRPIEQYHGKWPFYRLFGIQEPASVAFSLANYLAHYNGLHKIHSQIPMHYPLRPYYVLIAYFGMTAWVFSMVFHVRDFALTEQLDYFAAGATVLYGLYYTPIRIFRLYRDAPGSTRNATILRVWTLCNVIAYAFHVLYLKYYDWNYTYNMTANVICGLLQNAMWVGFSIKEYNRTGEARTLWPTAVVLWVLGAMSFEILDFPPIAGILDAHSLWHAGTVAPVVLFYNFLLQDAKHDLSGSRLKQ